MVVRLGAGVVVLAGMKVTGLDLALAGMVKIVPGLVLMMLVTGRIVVFVAAAELGRVARAADPANPR